MAGNSVPVFFGAKARTKRPPGLDVTSITDLSGSMQPFASFISSRATIVALENALIAQGVGVLSTNRYSFATGGTRSSDTLATIELPVRVNNVSQRWATGAEVINNTAVLPTLTANRGGDTEDMGIASNLVTNNDRGYLSANVKIIIAGSDEQATATTFTASPTFPHRYVGVHSVNLSITEPAGPNPVPAGTLRGFVYTTSTTGVAVYIDGTTINNRADVPVANVTATAASNNGQPTRQINVDQARLTNGAIYDIRFFNTGFELLAISLGNALGQFLFQAS
jgi:hypothetical protein